MTATTVHGEHPAAPLDKPTRLVTAALVVAVFGLAASIPAAEGGPVAMLFGWGVPLGAIALGYGMSPRGYRIEPSGQLRVLRRVFGSKQLRVESAQRTATLLGAGGLRLAGSGGVFGWYGWFWRRETGRYRAYVTDRSRLVACHGPDGLIIVSPEDPEAFIAAVGTP
ncbi:MAG TPA: PH domain-containing protein [Egibacteraceae bacterium]|nr:PH domain-containing protein [Egibacteraceae bacterium]